MELPIVYSSKWSLNDVETNFIVDLNFNIDTYQNINKNKTKIV